MEELSVPPEDDATVVKVCLEKVIRKRLEAEVYNELAVPTWVDGIIKDISKELKSLSCLQGYKHIISVNILPFSPKVTAHCEFQCFWDEETDYSANCTYQNDSISCHAVVYVVSSY